MNKQAEIDYFELKKLLAEMSELAGKMVSESVDSLITGNVELAKDIMERDLIVDQLEVKIDNICTKIIALYEPKASDLRYIVTALRIIIDLERIGDHAKNIAKQSIKLAALPKIKEYDDIQEMAQICGTMVQESIKAYFSVDADLANVVLHQDYEVDTLQTRITRELIETIVQNVDNTKIAIKLINITRRLERIADHAKNIAELIAFMSSAKN